MRILETTGNKATVNIMVDPVLIGKVCDACEVDFMECPLQHNKAEIIANNGFSVNIPAKGIASVKIGLNNK